jgi:hypothetical protein
MAALRLRRLQDRRRLGALVVALAFDGSEEVSKRLFVAVDSVGGSMHLLLGCWRLWFLSAVDAMIDALDVVGVRRLDAVAWLVRRLGGGCRLACTCTTARCCRFFSSWCFRRLGGGLSMLQEAFGVAVVVVVVVPTASRLPW